ncbi:thioredoxin family protein [Sulfurivermis fontis]|uniref:thioredoxin family protein n=1 Tax=Sulfurivermis fontis TaxID=1972068 RepID=UPI003B837236
MERVDAPARMAACRILTVPAVIVDGVLVYSGGIPTRWQIESWLTIPLTRKLTA